MNSPLLLVASIFSFFVVIADLVIQARRLRLLRKKMDDMGALKNYRPPSEEELAAYKESRLSGGWQLVHESADSIQFAYSGANEPGPALKDLSIFLEQKFRR